MVFTDGDNKLIPSEWFCLLLCGGRIEKMPGGGQEGSGGHGHCGLGGPPSGEVFLCSCGSWGLNPRGLVSVYLAHMVSLYSKAFPDRRRTLITMEALST